MSRSTVLLVLAAMLASGCAPDPGAPVSLPRWQRSLEQYVWQQADGDPTVLRDLSWDDVHPGFAMLGEALPEQSTDMFGLLLEHRRIDGKAYFVFLVATVHDRQVEALQPVALNVDAGQFHWFVGSSSPAGLEAYNRWTRSSEAGSGPGDWPLHFPASSDTFEVTAARQQIRILHEQTGSTWTIDLQHESGQIDRLDRTGQVSGSRAS
ncbi:MAG TPA: hypothetical protein VN541_16895 [Tepidisphaeraceae bacterium]|nr:hypothetical protein [Tepidisphaeraceae bacterium]